MDKSIKGAAGLQEVCGFIAGDALSESVPLSQPMQSVPLNTSAGDFQSADSWISLEVLKKEQGKTSWQWIAADIYGPTVLLENFQKSRKMYLY